MWGLKQHGSILLFLGILINSFFQLSSNGFSEELNPSSSSAKSQSTMTADAALDDSDSDEADSVLDLSKLDPFYNFSLGFQAGALFPLQNNVNRLEISPSFVLFANWNPHWFKHFFFRVEGMFSPYKFVNDTQANNRYIGIGLLPSLHWNIAGDFGLYVSAGGGYSFNSFKSDSINESGMTPAAFAKGNLGFEYTFREVPIALQVEGSYSVIYDDVRPFTSIGVQGGISYQFLDPAIIAMKQRRVEILSVKINPLFGALYTKYNEIPIGKMKIKNVSNRPLADIRTKFFVKRYMDTPKIGNSNPSLGPGETMDIDIHAVFNQQVLGITEDTILLSQLGIVYKDRGAEKEYITSKEFTLHNRNAMTWDDTKKLGSFITQNDEPGKAFSRGVVSAFDDQTPLNDAIKSATEIFIALGAYGVKYVSDPKTPFDRFSKSADLVDTINYPRETLMYNSGDCDDLVLLFCSLLENVGIQTAFVTVPGHIFMVFDTGVPLAQMDQISNQPHLVVQRNNTIWVPVEVTAVDKYPFSKAWEMGAKQIEKWSGSNNVDYVPIAEAQQIYPSVSLLPTDFLPIIPNVNSIKELVFKDFEILLSLANIETTDTLLEKAQLDPTNPQTINQLGVSYAKGEDWNKAEEQFKKVNQLDQRYFPAAYNLARVYLEMKRLPQAEEMIERCIQLQPNNPHGYLLFAQLILLK